MAEPYKFISFVQNQNMISLGQEEEEFQGASSSHSGELWIANIPQPMEGIHGTGLPPFLTGGSSSYSGEPSSAIPQPMEGLQGTGPPPFLTKTYDLVDDPNTNHIVSWSRGNTSFVVWDPQPFAVNLLPMYFKHANFSSFVRQLNTYGFRKVDPNNWEFANEEFIKGQRHLLKNIRRRKTHSHHPLASFQGLDPCVELGRFGLDAEIDRLRRDKQVLMVELVKLRQQQQSSKAYLKAMEERLKGAEMKQQQMMGFMAKIIQNPSFVHQLVQQKDRRKKVEEAISRKRRPIEQGETLEVVVQGLCGSSKKLDEEGVMERGKRNYSGDKALDQGFWEDMLNEGIEEEMGLVGVEGEDEEDLGLLAWQLGFLGSSPP